MEVLSLRRIGFIGGLLLCIAQLSFAQSIERPIRDFPSLISSPDHKANKDANTLRSNVERANTRKTKKFKRSRRVSIDTSLLQGVDRFAIDLFPDIAVLVELEKVTRNKHDRIVWRGRVHSVLENGVQVPARGKVTLVLKDDALVGTVRLNGELYEIEHGLDGEHRLREVETNAFPEDHPAIESPDALNSSGATSVSAPLPQTLAASSDIRLLVLYTQAVAAQVADVPSLIDLAIDETNQSFGNSEVGGDVQVSLSSGVQINYLETTYSEMLTALASDTDGVLDHIHDLRYQEEADAVVLLVDQPDYCGIGYINAPYDRAFAVVNYACATGNYSFAHELGHLAGARHDIHNDSSTTPFAYGHGYQSINLTFRTIMAYNCDAGSCPRVDSWSNPEVEYSGEFMGEFGISDNARVWREQAVGLANLHENYIPPNADRELWFFNISERVYSSPVIDENNVVYFAGRDANIYSLNDDMTVNWQQAVSQGITSGIALESGVIYFRTTDAGEREFGAIDAATGAPLWSNPISSNGGAPAVASDGSSYITDGTWLKLYDSSGEFVRQVLIAATAYATPVIAEDGSVLVMISNGQLRSYSSDLTTLQWTSQLPASYARQCLAIGIDGEIYAAGVNGVLYALDSNGNYLWEYVYDSSNYDRCPVVDLNNNIIIGDNNGVVHAIGRNGTLAWQSAPLDSGIKSTAAIMDNGDILVGTSARLYAINSTGQLLWSSPLSLNNQSSVAIADNGIAYIGDASTNNGGLRAIDVTGQKLAETVWPRNGGGNNGSNRFERPENHSPLVSINSPLDGAVISLSDGPVSLQATASDYEDGDLTNAIAWASDIDGSIVSPVLLSEGVHTLTASVEDSNLATGSDVIFVTVEDDSNTLPAITINSPISGSEISEDDNPISFSVAASDAEDGDLTTSVMLTSDIDGVITSPANLSVGIHQITASVTDSANATVTDVITLEILPHINLPPTIAITSPASASVISEDDNPITFTYTANDPEDGDLTASVVLTSTIDGVITSPANLSVGVHQITASVTDSNGANSNNVIALEILAHVNVPPTIAITSPVSGSVISEDDNPIAFTFTANDAEDGNLSASVVLMSDIDGVITSPANLSVGVHQITASVTDSAGANTSDVISLEVLEHVNVAPTVSITSPIDGYQHNLNEGDLTFIFNASDLEDGDLTASVELSSDLDGIISNPAANLSLGQHTITAMVTDAGGLSSQDTVLINVVQPPLQTQINIVQNFDGLPGAGEGWSYYSSNSSLGRIRIQNSELLMDVSTNGNYNLNEAVLEVDLEGFTNVELSFKQADYGDEQHTMPSTFTGHVNADGVAISMDGNAWYSAINSGLLETSTAGNTYTINIDDVVENIRQNYDVNFQYDNAFYIKFQQYDNYAHPTDGRGWDNINLTAEIVFLEVSLPETHMTVRASDLGLPMCGTINMTNVSESVLSWDASSSNPALSLSETSGGLDPTISENIDACWDTLGLSIGDALESTVIINDATNGMSYESSFSINVVDDATDVPYLMNFDNGLPVQNEEWEFYSSSSVGRITEVSGAMRMDVSVNGNSSVNEAVLTLDLSNQQNLVLQFFQRETSDENHTLSNYFTGHSYGDGVAISADGITWYTIVSAAALDVGTAGQLYSIDLDAEVARIRSSYDASFEYNGSFSIKFQQFDNYTSPTDGREWDDISITVQ